jgi:hypothetical protein
MPENSHHRCEHEVKVCAGKFFYSAEADVSLFSAVKDDGLYIQEKLIILIAFLIINLPA